MATDNSKSTGITNSPLNNRGFRALVVDNYPPFQELLGLSLSTFPQIEKIDFADSGAIAIEKSEAATYDLIFLDVMMAEVDGYETCSRLRTSQAYKKTPIIMVSGKNTTFDEFKGINSGCTAYVTKPIQQEAFQKLCNEVLTWLQSQRSSNTAD